MLLIKLQNESSTFLKAKYEAADLNKLVSACDHLLFPHQQQLIQLLDTYEGLFDETLGTWQGDP
jgi:hypothetical protein